MATLYELSVDYEQAILNGFTVDAETGEVTDYSPEMLEQLGDDLDAKLENCALFIKNIQSDIDGIRTEEKKLAYRRKVKENKLKAMKEYVLSCMQLGEVKKMATPRVEIGTRVSHKLVVDDINLVPEKYVTVKTDRKADAMQIKRDLKTGKDIAGVHIEDSESLNIK